MKEEILFDLDILLGNWESVNLHPTIMINRNQDKYLLSIIHISETTKQAQPATYEILTDDNGYYIYKDLKRVSISYNKKLDMLTLPAFGEYMHN